jgi:hypothetical protein
MKLTTMLSASLGGLTSKNFPSRNSQSEHAINFFGTALFKLSTTAFCLPVSFYRRKTVTNPVFATDVVLSFIPAIGDLDRQAIVLTTFSEI